MVYHMKIPLSLLEQTHPELQNYLIITYSIYIKIVLIWFFNL